MQVATVEVRSRWRKRHAMMGSSQGVGCTAVREAACNGEGGVIEGAGGGAASRSAREDESEGVA